MEQSLDFLGFSDDTFLAFSDDSYSTFSDDSYSTFSDCDNDRLGEFWTASLQNRLFLLSCAADNSDDLIRQVVSDLESCSIDLQRQAALEIRLLTKNKKESRLKIAQAGAIKPLLSLISSTDSQLQEYCVTAILNLSLCDENRGLITASGAINPLVQALTTGTTNAKENAACALLRLSQLEENKIAIGQSGAIPLLVHLLENGRIRGKKDACTALYSLSSVKENKVRAVQAGIMKTLVKVMADFGSGMVDKAGFVLSNIVSIPEGKITLVEEGGIPVLVEIVEVGSQRQKEIATIILLQICEDNLAYRTMVAREGAIPPLVALSHSGTARAKQKAEVLLDLLHWPRSGKNAARSSDVSNLVFKTVTPNPGSLENKRREKIENPLSSSTTTSSASLLYLTSSSSSPPVTMTLLHQNQRPRGQYSAEFLLDQLDSYTFRKIRHILEKPEDMGLGDITLISFPLLLVLLRLEMSLTMLRDEELQKSGDPAKQKCLEHHPLFEALGQILEHIAPCVSEQTPFSLLPVQAQRDEALDIINSVYDNSVALSNISLQLENIGKLDRFASSEEMGQIGKLEMAERPHKDPLLPVYTYPETAQSKPGKDQGSYMGTKVNEGSTSEFANTSEVCKSFHNLPQHLKRCVIYTCILFLGDYEFEEATLIQLWIAVGFIQTGQEQLPERGLIYFQELHRLAIFQMSSIVCENYESSYRVHKDVYELIRQDCPNEYAIMEEGGPKKITPVTLHSTLLLDDKICNFDVKIFERFYEAELLRTLKLQNECGRPIKHVSHNFFVKLRFLRVLDLSSTEIKELPTSVCNLRHLRYLDVSNTRMRKLPESVSKLYNLETLKLRDCSDLVGLPSETSKLINLQYLDLDGVHQLTKMPPRMGQLTNLQYLSIFIVGQEEGFRIEELKYMKKLRGSLCIAKMENVTKDQVNEAQLGDMDTIHKLEFQWSSSQGKGATEFNLIEPHHSIKQLKITRYSAESFPNWLSSEKFYRLTVIHLRNCNCTHLPDLGKLPSLKSLYIHEMYSLKEINHEFYGAFLKLEVLEIDGMPCLEEWTTIKEDDMPSLRELTIIECPKLVALPQFKNLKSLKHLRITLCPEIQSFPGERLPENLQSLTITECAKLEEQCRKEEGNEWCKIQGIPEIWIEYQQISQTRSN